MLRRGLARRPISLRGIFISGVRQPRKLASFIQQRQLHRNPCVPEPVDHMRGSCPGPSQTAGSWRKAPTAINGETGRKSHSDENHKSGWSRMRTCPNAVAGTALLFAAGGGSALSLCSEEDEEATLPFHTHHMSEVTAADELQASGSQDDGIHYIYKDEEDLIFDRTRNWHAEEPPPNNAPLGSDNNKKDKVINLDQEMLKKRKVMLFGPIDDRQAYVVCMKLMYLEGEDPGKPIELIINSPGGKVPEGLAIYDCMQLVSSPIHTVCWGRAYSMAAVLLAAGDKGHRSIFPNAKVMIHQPSLQIPLSVASDIMIKNKSVQDTKDQLKRLLALHMGQEEAWVETMSERDTYMNPAEAIKYGMVDYVATNITVSKL